MRGSWNIFRTKYSVLTESGVNSCMVVIHWYRRRERIRTIEMDDNLMDLFSIGKIYRIPNALVKVVLDKEGRGCVERMMCFPVVYAYGKKGAW